MYLIVTPDVEKNIKFCKEVNLVYIDYTPDKNLYVSGHITGMAYTRLFIAELIPQIDKCIYLDCDTIIYNSLEELWEIDINDYCYGAKINNHFIFSGILLINLALIRKYEYIKKYKEYILNNKIIEFHDCTILNEFHRNNTKKISNKYNDRFLNKETIIHHTHEYNNALNFNAIKRHYKYLSTKSIRNRETANVYTFLKDKRDKVKLCPIISPNEYYNNIDFMAMVSIIYKNGDELEDEEFITIFTCFNVEVSFTTKQINLNSTIYTIENNPDIIADLNLTCDHYHQCNNQCLVCGETVSHKFVDHIDYTPEQLFTFVFDNYIYYNHDIYHVIQKQQSTFKLKKLIKEAIDNEKNNQDNTQILNKIEKLIKRL